MLVHQLDQRLVARRGLTFGMIDGFVKAACCPARCRGHEALHQVLAVGNGARGADHGGAHDGAGIDHRIVRPVVGVQRQLVETAAGGFAADMAVHLVLAVQRQGEGIIQRFHHRLQAEGLFCIAQGETLAVQAAHGQAELVRVLAGQFGDIAGHGAGAVLAGIVEQIGDAAGKPAETGNGQLPVQRALHEAQRIGRDFRAGFEHVRFQRTGLPLQRRFQAGKARDGEIDPLARQPLRQRLRRADPGLFRRAAQRTQPLLLRRPVAAIMLEARTAPAKTGKA